MFRKFFQKLHEIKHKIKMFKDYFSWRINNWFKYIKNPTIRKQLKNPKSIPIIIISFNQLFYLKQLIDFLLSRKFLNIIIIDNNSTFLPLLDYFDELQNNTNITIHRLKENDGHLVFWKNIDLFKKYSKGYYVVSDADIVPLESTPENFIKKFINLLNSNMDITKVGFSLYLDDLPDHNPNKETIVNWENQFWLEPHENHFKASIDTTFALYRPNYIRLEESFLKAIRTNKPYTARHGGWYINPTKLSEEQKYYINTANNSSSWLTDENGELKNEFFKSHYKK
ncbi:MAG: family 2 glycosyl transferase [Flavobacteriales bacterium CG18_big_fil_WC_8_21_14_2_50_32_9]|nr:MAG: family 2 glycosyl transferase [Flavobacteriales bacterium CG18_big_fil_WC_8_21_14_2_50_32_9]